MSAVEARPRPATDPVAVAARDAHVAELLAEGLNATEIAVIVGITERSVQRSKKRLGLARPQHPPLSEAEIQLARNLLEDGANFAEVARTLGRNVTTISDRFRGMSRCTPREAYQIRRMMAELDSLDALYRKPGCAVDKERH